MRLMDRLKSHKFPRVEHGLDVVIGKAMFMRLASIFRGEDARQLTGAAGGPDELQRAVAALLVEAANMDGDIDDAERNTIEELLTRHFDLDGDAVRVLVEAGVRATDNSVQLYPFTRAIKEGLTHEDRVRVIEMLWAVAYADGELHDYEAVLVRRVAGLIYVPDRESGAARQRALGWLQLAPVPGD
jgi:uncharacterized tellurite resistance protein B-like protein